MGLLASPIVVWVPLVAVRGRHVRGVEMVGRVVSCWVGSRYDWVVSWVVGSGLPCCVEWVGAGGDGIGVRAGRCLGLKWSRMD
jgi:hypothetical protein